MDSPAGYLRLTHYLARYCFLVDWDIGWTHETKVSLTGSWQGYY